MGSAVMLNGIGGELPSFITKLDWGIFVPQEDIQTPTIQHNLGVVPKVVFIYDADEPDDLTSGDNAYNFVSGFAVNKNQLSSYSWSNATTAYRDSGGRIRFRDVEYYAGYFGIYDDKIRWYYNTTWYMRAGHHYHWVVCA